MSSGEFDEKSVISGPADIGEGDGTDWNLMITSWLGGAFRIDELRCCADKATDTIIELKQYYTQSGAGGAGLFARVTIPASAGWGTDPSADVLALLFGEAGHFLIQTVGQGLAIRVPTALGSGEVLHFFWRGGDL